MCEAGSADKNEDGGGKREPERALLGFFESALNALGPIKNDLLKVTGIGVLALIVGIFLLPEEHRIIGYVLVVFLLAFGLGCHTVLEAKGYKSIPQAQLQEQGRIMRRKFRPRHNIRHKE